MPLGKSVITALGLLIGSAGTVTGAAQTIPVRVYRGSASFAIREDTSAEGRAERLLEAYFRRRLEALGVKLTESDSVYAFEVHFSVLPLVDGRYDVAFVSTICVCDPASRRAGGMRTQPFDWHQFHEHDDLEEIARNAAENVFNELKAVETLRSRMK